MNRLPIGIENFKAMIDEGYYYVDKTLFIKDVLNEKSCTVHKTASVSQNSIDTFGIRQEAR